MAQGVQAAPAEMFSAAPSVAVGDRTAVVPVTIFGETIESTDPLFRISARAVLTDLLPNIAAFLEDEIRKRDRGCRERWSAGDGAADLQDGALRAKVTVRIEKWACEKILGREMKTRIARETGTIHASLVPEIVDGRLRIRLRGFRIDDLSRLSRELGLENYVRRRLEAELQKGNSNSMMTDLPAPLRDIGFSYDAADLKTENGVPVAELAITGPNNPVALVLALTNLAR